MQQKGLLVLIILSCATGTDAEAFVYCHDWLYGGGNFGQLVYHSFDILVYL